MSKYRILAVDKREFIPSARPGQVAYEVQELISYTFLGFTLYSRWEPIEWSLNAFDAEKSVQQRILNDTPLATKEVIWKS